MEVLQQCCFFRTRAYAIGNASPASWARQNNHSPEVTEATRCCLQLCRMKCSTQPACR